MFFPAESIYFSLKKPYGFTIGADRIVRCLPAALLGRSPEDFFRIDAPYNLPGRMKSITSLVIDNITSFHDIESPLLFKN